jgi:hypothetical protein
MARIVEKKPHFREKVKTFAEAYFQKDFANLRGRQQSEAMLRLYLRDVYYFNVEPLSEAEIDEGICDGTDAGVDFIRRDNDRVLLIQAKYRGDGSAPEILNDLISFQSVIRRIHPTLGRSFTKNRRLTEAAAEIDFQADTFHLEYITLGRFQDSAAKVLAEGVSEIESLPDLRTRATMVSYDEQGLNEQLRIALSQSEGIPESVDLFLAEPSSRVSSAIEYETSHKTLLGVVTGTALVNMYRQHKEQLFTLNVRSYLGRTKTNKEIVSTIKREPEEFLNYNNGVAFVCNAYDWNRDSRKLTLKRPQIINGAQTIRCLVAAGEGLDKKVLVAAKITEMGDFFRADNERFFNNVIRYSNTQNVIKDIDFRSNDPVQVDIERQFQGMAFRGKPVFYQRKRTDKKKGVAPYTIPVTEFCKNLYSFFFNPTDFASKSAFLFDDNAGQGYPRLFGDGTEVSTTLPRERFQAYAAAWWVCQLSGEWRAVDRKRYLDAGQQNEAAALLSGYFVFAAMRLLLEKKYAGSSWETALRLYHKPDWCDDLKSRKYLNVKSLYELAKGTVVRVYLEAAENPGHNARNWLRAPDTFKKLSSVIQNMVPQEFIPEMQGSK